MSTNDQIPHGPFTPSNSLVEYNNLVDVVNQIQDYVYQNIPQQGVDVTGGDGSGGLDIFVGLTTETPPSGGSAYTDARYWVTRSVAPDPSKASISSSYSGGSLTDNLTAVADPFNGHLPLPQTVTATNIAELPSTYGAGGGSNKGTHTIQNNTIVLVVGFPNRAKPTQRAYFFIAAPPGTVVVKITSNAAGDGKYNGTIYGGSPSPSAGGGLAMPESMTAGASCLAINIDETGLTGWRLKANSWAIGIQAGTVSEDPTTPVVVIHGGVGSRTSPKVLTPGTYGSPNATGWSKDSDGTPVTFSVITSMGFDSGTEKWWWNTATVSADARGILYAVSAETQSTQDSNAC